MGSEMCIRDSLHVENASEIEDKAVGVTHVLEIPKSDLKYRRPSAEVGVSAYD